MSWRLAMTVLVALAAGAYGAEAQPKPKPRAEACFLSRDWSNWKPSPDSRAIYLRVGVKQVFRVDLQSSCPELKAPDARLITKLRGGDWICSPLDLDLQVAEGPPPGFAVPCLVKGISQLTPDQIAALPKGSRP